MLKPTLLAIFSFSFSLAYCQQNILVFKKGEKVIHRYWKGATIAFQLNNKQWQKGEITGIQNDSFYIRPRVVHYNLMGTDTFYYNIRGFSLTDVFAVPKKGVLIDYRNGRFQISGSGGHVHWYWLKAGGIFKLGAAGYAFLNIANGLINNNFSFSDSKTQLLTAVAVYLVGVVLQKTYKPFLRMGRKFHLEVLNFSN